MYTTILKESGKKNCNGNNDQIPQNENEKKTLGWYLRPKI